MNPAERRPRKGDIAFWRYDGYPYVLSGTIEGVIEQKSDGRWVATVREYGVGRFTISYSLPKKRGKEVAARFEELRAADRLRREEAGRESARQLKATLDELELPRNNYQESAEKRIDR